MDIYILGPTTQILDMIDTFESVIWTVQYFNVGEFEMIVPATKKNIELLQKDRLLCRDKDHNGDIWRNVMIIENIKTVADYEKGDSITISGRGLKSIVGRRVVWQQTNLTGNVEAGIRQVLTENIITPTDEKRKIDNFILDEPAEITDTFDAQLLGEDLDEWIMSTCQTYGIGWDVYIKGGKFVFKLYKGCNRSYEQKDNLPVVFSDEFDNLLASTYTYERAEFKNAALVAGEGEGVNQRTTTVGDTSGLERYETYIDGSGISSNGTIITEEQYYKMLRDYAKDELNTTSFTETFEGNVVPDGNYNLNEDYFLGDIVQVINEYGISANPRIVEIIESEDENGKSTVPTFSTWEV